MKKQFKLYLAMLIVAFLNSTNVVSAQNYTLTTLSSPYADLTGATSLNNGVVWDDPEYTIPLGFSFTAFGVTFDSIGTAFGLGGELVIGDPSDSNLVHGFSPIYDDIMDRAYDFANPNEGSPGSLSDLSYKTEGAVGNRIFKMQWKNVGFYDEIELDSISSDYINFQAWFYENGNIVEFRYGSSQILDPVACYDLDTGATVSYYSLDTVNLGEDFYLVSGSPTAPTLYRVDSSQYFPVLSGDIPSGTVYRFAPIPDGISTVKPNSELQIYPNPSTQTIHIKNVELSKIRSIEVLNILGQKCADLKPDIELDIADLTPGIYTLKVLTEDRIYLTKLQKD